MPPNPFFSTLSRQVIGGLAGMVAATMLYFSIQNLTSGTTSLKGLLVDTTTVSQNAARVRISDKNVDDATFQRIASRAKTVAALVEQSKPAPVAVIAPSDTANQRAAFIAARREARKLAAASVSVSAAQNVQIHAAAGEVTQPIHASGLPHSGPALWALIMLSCSAALFALRKKTQVMSCEF